jgi:hypothetical protein
LHHLSTYMFLIHYHIVWCLGYCSRWFCEFELVDSMIWLLYLHGLFVLILVYAHTSVHFLILHLFPCIW